jgi:hypothetical protein
VRRIGDVLVADLAKRALGRLDREMHEVRADRVEPGDPEPVELAEDRKRDRALRRRRHVEDSAERMLEHERRAALRDMGFEVGERDG